MTAERVQYHTTDNVTIVADWYPGLSGWALILLHMMPATRSSWAAFAAQANADGFSVLVPDLRGHGESIQRAGDVLSFETFSDEEHRSSLSDVAAAHAWLKKRGVTDEHILLAGASVGANLAVAYLAEHPALPGCCLLSAGNYRGLDAVALAGRCTPQQSIFAVASSEDALAAATLQPLEVTLRGPHVVRMLEHAGHGTTMLERDATLTNELLQWANDLKRAYGMRS